jgi:type VI secretion system protein VasG
MNRERRFGRLGESVYGALVDATALCQSRQHQFVELDHWLWCLWQREAGDLHRFINLLNADAARFVQRLGAAVSGLPQSQGGIRDLSGTLEHAMASALGWSQLAGCCGHVRSGHLLLACLEDAPIRRWLDALLPEIKGRSMEELTELYESQAAQWQEFLEPSVDGAPALTLPMGGADGNAAAPGQGDGLQRWAVSMSAQAAKNVLDPVVGRDAELRQVIDILLRRRQNNPLLVGEAGVGKTAIAEALARRIHEGLVPPGLRDAQVWALDLGSMQAGASARGEFEQRLRSVLDAIASAPCTIILFCDEVHTLVGAGGNAGTGDAANLIKPMLARGQLRMMAATTWSEYKQYIEPDAALTRRFQQVVIDEPSDERALAMLRVIASRFAEHHGVHIADSALSAAVHLSRRHLPARQLPDKAISLLDTACARVAMSQNAKPAAMDALDEQIQAANQALDWGSRDGLLGLEVEDDKPLRELRDSLLARMSDMSQALESQRGRVQALLEEFARSGRVDRAAEANGDLLAELASSRPDLWVRPWVDAQVIASVLSEWTGVPSTHLAINDVDRMLKLEQELGARIHGQDGALRQIIDSLQVARAGLNDPERPLGVFMLAGPTGTGKTETAIALSDQLFGGAEYLIHFNMNEFQEPHSVSTLKGAPPGYVGYGKGGRLTEAVRRRPYSVVLLDEFDQAHRDVHEVFYQVFDKGWMEDGEGRRISFRNCLILLTSNVGAEQIEAACQAQADLEAAKLTGIAHQALSRHFAPALLARMQVVGFKPLDKAAMAQIADRTLSELSGRLAEGGIVLNADGDVREWVARIAIQHPAKGRAARDLLRQIALPTIAQGVLSAKSLGRPLNEVCLSAPSKLQIEFLPALDEGAVPTEIAAGQEMGHEMPNLNATPELPVDGTAH